MPAALPDESHTGDLQQLWLRFGQQSPSCAAYLVPRHASDLGGRQIKRGRQGTLPFPQQLQLGLPCTHSARTFLSVLTILHLFLQSHSRVTFLGTQPISVTAAMQCARSSLGSSALAQTCCPGGWNAVGQPLDCDRRWDRAPRGKDASILLLPCRSTAVQASALMPSIA